MKLCFLGDLPVNEKKEDGAKPPPSTQLPPPSTQLPPPLLLPKLMPPHLAANAAKPAGSLSVLSSVL